MKKIILLSYFSVFSVLVFASFPVDIIMDPEVAASEKFKLDTTAFIIGILTFFLLPYSLVLLFIRKKNFRGSLAWGWLVGLILLVLFFLFVLFSFIGFPEMPFY
tara:strand:- start:180 stop:491 length:312 start_codon:yes stop_codon:yes gene_type:complete